MRKNKKIQHVIVIILSIIITMGISPGIVIAEISEDITNDAFSTNAISWDNLQEVIDTGLDGDVIDLSSLSTPQGGKSYTFVVNSNRSITLKGNGTQINNITFLFYGNNRITIENINIKSANYPPDNIILTNYYLGNNMLANYPLDNNTLGYSPLHFAGKGNTLIVKGYNTVTSGQTRWESGYGAAVGVPIGSELIISDESDGVLYATGGAGGAAVGGGYNVSCGDITINGGTITSYATYWSLMFAGAGIGGGALGSGGNITINGGTIRSRGGAGGAGIGGGTEGAAGAIVINGGTIYSKGGLSGAGIGGGTYGSGGNIIITGGSIEAYGQEGADNIGAGINGEKGTIKNSTGDELYLNILTIPSKADSPIVGGSINDVACIGGISNSRAYGINDIKTDIEGKVYLYLPVSGNEGKIKEAISLTAGDKSGYIRYARSNMTIEKKLSLLEDIPKDWDEVGFYVNYSSRDVIDISELSTPEDGTSYVFNVHKGRSFTLKGSGVQIDNIAFWFEGNNNITIENLNIKSADNHTDVYNSSKKGYAPIYFSGKENVLIYKGTNNIINGQSKFGVKYGAAIGVSVGTELAIHSLDGDTTASLNVRGGENGPGIGSTDNDFMSGRGYSINIYNGIVNATGGNSAPAIGDSSLYGGIVRISGGTFNLTGGNSSSAIKSETIYISGGTIDAKGGPGGSGIGMGSHGGYTTVNISGGIVTATGGANAAGIGDSYMASGTKVRISGGQVTATAGKNGSGIGGYLGEVHISGGEVIAIGGNGNYDEGGAGIGYSGPGGSVNISGGTITATGALGHIDRFMGGSSFLYPSGPGIGGNKSTVVISGGSVNAKGGMDTQDVVGKLINGASSDVFLNTLTIPNAVNAHITSASINNIVCVESEPDGNAYGIKDVKTDDHGKVYFYLPISDNNETIILTVDGVEYSKEYKRNKENNVHTLIDPTMPMVTPPKETTTDGEYDSGEDDKAPVIVLGQEIDQPISSLVSIMAKNTDNNIARFDIPSKLIDDTIAKAKLEWTTWDKTSMGIAIEIDMKMPKQSTSLEATLNRNSLNNLINTGVTSFKISGPLMTTSFDLKSLESIQKQTSGNLTINIEPVKANSSSAKKIIGKRQTYDININYIKKGKKAKITTLKEGNVTVGIPYTLGKKEVVGGLYGVYVDEKGKAINIPQSVYDEKSGKVIFNTTHFSVYGVGYVAPTTKYTDINNHWAKDSIDYVVGRGLISGTLKKTFSPDKAITQEELVTALDKLSEVDIKKDKGEYESGDVITREEMADILYNYAKEHGYILPIIHKPIPYTDAVNINNDYKEAVTAMQQAGIMIWDSGNNYNPKLNVTRAEFAVILHRYTKISIDPSVFGNDILALNPIK